MGQSCVKDALRSVQIPSRYQLPQLKIKTRVYHLLEKSQVGDTVQ